MLDIKLPDFDDMVKTAEQIGKLLIEQAILSAQIKELEATAVSTATNSPEYAVDGKTPSMTYINSTFKITGLKDELIPLRKRLAEVDGELEAKKIMFYLMKDMIDVWRTQQANERLVLS